MAAKQLPKLFSATTQDSENAHQGSHIRELLGKLQDIGVSGPFLQPSIKYHKKKLP